MNRMLLGVLTLWPVAYLILFMGVVVAAVAQGAGDPDDGGFLVPFGVLMGLHLATMVLILILLVVYIRDAYLNQEIDDGKRVFWAIVLFLGNVIAMPVYWWMYMRPGRRPAPGAVG